MQPDNNNMDKKLKQLENQSLPDLSKMDEHWENMKSALQPKDSLPKERMNNRILRWIVAASVAAILFFVSYKFIFNSNNDKNITVEAKQSPVTNKTPIDTLTVIKAVPGKGSSLAPNKNTIRFLPVKEKPKPPKVIFKGKNNDGKEIEVIAVPVNDSANKKPGEKNKTLKD